MNAIITAATGYRHADLRPFLASVGRVCPDATLFLIAYEADRETLRGLQQLYPFLQPVFVSRKFNRGGKVYRWMAKHFIDQDYSTCGSLPRTVGRYSLHIMLERFFLALEIVQSNRHSLDNVLLTDSRDVILQADPFRHVGRTAISGLEEKTIGECDLNSSWIRGLYGDEIQSRLSRNRIVCAGVTLGPAAEIETYLTRMCEEIWKRLAKLATIAQFDQGIHNYLIHTKQVEVRTTDNRGGIIATLHHERAENIGTDAATGAVTVHGKVPAIVHQYDRHRNVMAFVNHGLGEGAQEPASP